MGALGSKAERRAQLAETYAPFKGWAAPDVSYGVRHGLLSLLSSPSALRISDRLERRPVDTCPQ